MSFGFSQPTWDSPDVACHLVVSLNTARTHTKRICTKSGVSNRLPALNKSV